MDKIKLHCGVTVDLISDFGSFFFMCPKCKAISNSFDSYKESPDDIEPRRIQFKKR
jgi:phage FluMu protein Com